jgi:hypothetical protein
MLSVHTFITIQRLPLHGHPTTDAQQAQRVRDGTKPSGTMTVVAVAATNENLSQLVVAGESLVLATSARLAFVERAP